MRITRKEPKIGTTREITKFLLWPMVINDEMRWLEKVTYRQVWSSYIVDDAEYRGQWDNECWID